MTTQGRVQVVTDESACLAPEVARKLGIRVVPLQLNDEDGDARTAAISPLEFCAAYARALERSSTPAVQSLDEQNTDAGVVAIHLSKGMSASWSNAVAAAGVLDRVRVLDTDSIGAGLGAAAIAAAKCSLSGGDLDECAEAAENVLRRYRLWLYVPKLEPLRKGGRIPTGQAVLSTALAIKPIVGISDGQLALVAKCRTEAKMKERLVEFAREMVENSTDVEHPPHVLLHHADALDDVEELQAMLSLALPEGTKFRILSLPDSLVAHTGPGAYAVGVISGGSPEAGHMELSDGVAARLSEVDEIAAGNAQRAVVTDEKGAPLFTTMASKLPTWSENRRAALEKADKLAKAIAELARRDHSDPEGAQFGQDAKKSEDSADSEKPGESGTPVDSEESEESGEFGQYGREELPPTS